MYVNIPIPTRIVFGLMPIVQQQSNSKANANSLLCTEECHCHSHKMPTPLVTAAILPSPYLFYSIQYRRLSSLQPIAFPIKPLQRNRDFSSPSKRKHKAVISVLIPSFTFPHHSPNDAIAFIPPVFLHYCFIPINPVKSNSPA